MTIVESDASVTGGVDTHLDLHVAAALDHRGGLFGVEEFKATGPGFDALLAWLAGFGPVARVGIEGTGSYGAGLARAAAAAGLAVVEVDRPNRQERYRRGKSDPSMPSPQHEPPSQDKRGGWPSPETGRWRPWGPWW